jgi:hypothetical protein
LSFSPDIIRVIKSRRMKCQGHVAHVGEKKNVERDLLGSLNHLEDTSIDR